MKDQILKLFVLLLIFLAGVNCQFQRISQFQNETSTDSDPVPIPIQKAAESRNISDEEQEYHVRVPPPFVEEFAGIPRPPRRWPDKKREVREVITRERLPSSTPSCGEHVNACSCCCKYCWEVSFQSLKLCFNACSSAHENCSCNKSRFHPLDFKKS